MTGGGLVDREEGEIAWPRVMWNQQLHSHIELHKMSGVIKLFGLSHCAEPGGKPIRRSSAGMWFPLEGHGNTGLRLTCRSHGAFQC